MWPSHTGTDNRDVDMDELQVDVIIILASTRRVIAAFRVPPKFIHQRDAPDSGPQLCNRLLHNCPCVVEGAAETCAQQLPDRVPGWRHDCRLP